jgi:hypothetical protein
LYITFLTTSKLVDGDIDNLLISWRKLTSFTTNFPVKSEILNVITKNAQQLRKRIFHSNEFFPLYSVENFMVEMCFLSKFYFVINDNIGSISFSFDDKLSCCSLDGFKTVRLYSNTDTDLLQQYLALFVSVPVQCQIVRYYHVSISSKMLKSLITNNFRLKELRIYDCNIPPVIESLREVFQKCKQLVLFKYSDRHNLMTAEQLQSLFSQPTTLQIIQFDCNPNITSVSLVFLVQNSPLLTELCLNNTKDLDLTTLSDYMKNVKSNVKFTMKD